MQERHINRRQYFEEQAATSRKYYLKETDYFVKLRSGIRVLEVGCGESGDLQNDYVMLQNAPSRPYNKVYEIDMDRHMHDGHNWLYLNLDMKDLAPIATTSLKDSTQMYFSCDVGKFLDCKNGIMDLQA